MRTLLSNTEKDAAPSGIYPRYQSITEGTSLDPSSTSYRYDSPALGQSLQIKREDLSPVSRFREENVYTKNRPTASRVLIQPNRKESAVPIYEPQPRSLSINKQYTDSPSRLATTNSGRYDSYNFFKNFGSSSNGADPTKLQSPRRPTSSNSYATNISPSTRPATKLSGGYTYDPIRNKYQSNNTNYRLEYSDNEDDKVY